MARKPRTQSAPNQAPAGIGDNSAAVEAAERAQLLSGLSQLRPLIKQRDDDKTIAKASADAVTEKFRLLKAAGFQRQDLESYLADSAQSSVTVHDREVRRVRHRRWLGLSIGETDDMHDRMPLEAKSEMQTAAEGYTAGLTGLDRDAPTGTHPRMVTIWLSNYDKGVDEAREIIAGNAPKPMPTVAEQAETDFRADEAAARKAANKLKESGFLETGGPDAGDDSQTADQFEASEAELAAQAGRPSTVETAGDIT